MVKHASIPLSSKNLRRRKEKWIKMAGLFTLVIFFVTSKYFPHEFSRKIVPTWTPFFEHHSCKNLVYKNAKLVSIFFFFSHGFSRKISPTWTPFFEHHSCKNLVYKNATLVSIFFFFSHGFSRKIAPTWAPFFEHHSCKNLVYKNAQAETWL